MYTPRLSSSLCLLYVCLSIIVLNCCQRCLLCRRRIKLRRSHIFPHEYLKIHKHDYWRAHTMIGKMVKKSAGEMAFGMLYGQCEQCLCQNGKNQFSVHHKICVKREVVLEASNALHTEGKMCPWINQTSPFKFTSLSILPSICAISTWNMSLRLPQSL